MINDWSAQFFHRRLEFIRNQSLGLAGDEPIEGYVMWGACVDTLSKIHGLSQGRSIKDVGKTFVRGLRELAPDFHLERISVPLLHHDLVHVARWLESHPALSRYRRASSAGIVWQASDDDQMASDVANLKKVSSGCGDLMEIFRSNSYAALSYDQYRNGPVHNLMHGPKTTGGFGRDKGPSYMNHSYLPESGTRPEHRYRTRICFPLAWLADVLDEMIVNIHVQCNATGYVIDPNELHR